MTKNMKESIKDILKKYPKGIPSKEIRKDVVPLFENNDYEAASKSLHSKNAMEKAFNSTHFQLK